MAEIAEVQGTPTGAANPLFVHRLALHLKKSVEEIRWGMSARELHDWSLYFRTEDSIAARKK